MTKIMIVDDHPVFRHGLTTVLKEHPGFQIVGEASNGVEAVTRASELQPDVVVMDIRMPGGNGAEATAALREILPEIKVLILTVSDKDDDLFAAMEAGARGYLLKSTELNELITGIKAVAGGDVIISPTMASRLIDQLKQVNRHRAGEERGELSPRESEVLKLVARGDSNKGIAAGLFISETTVKAHLRSILEKLHVRNRAEAVAKATARGLLK